MRSIVLSILFCAFCIHQGYSASLPEPVPEEYTNYATCLAEQKLDLSVFGASSWKDFEGRDRYVYLETLEENKRNALVACLFHRFPFNGLAVPYIIKKEDGTYQFNEKGGEVFAYIVKACKGLEHDLNKFAGCFYVNNKWQPK